MTSPLRLRYVDSSLLLALLNRESIAAGDGTTRFNVALRIFRNAAAGEYRLLTSVLTIAEVRTTAGGTVDSYRPQSEAGIFGLPYLRLVSVDRRIAFAAQRLGDEYRLKPPDAIHLATAIRYGCGELLVWDEAFVRRVSRRPIPGLWVGEPY